MKAQLIVAASMLAMASTAGAQSLKPGLWELTHKMQTSSGQMEQQMAQAKRKMANRRRTQRKMMKERRPRRGVKMGRGGPAGGTAMKICMTKEMVERNELPTQRGDCKTTQQARTGNTMKVA